jgi:hypothetical protein
MIASGRPAHADRPDRVAPRTIRVDGQEVRISWHQALNMPVWICPRCGAVRYKLIKVGDRWGCRGCFGLRWRCRHRTGAAGLSRLLSLRRRLRSPVPFAPIQRPPLHAHKRIKLIAEVRRIEARLAQQTSADVVEVLEKRYERRHERQRSREDPRRQTTLPRSPAASGWRSESNPPTRRMSQNDLAKRSPS